MSVAVHIRHIDKTFRTQPVLDDVCLTVEAGELLALLGPSGSGKTTLLRTIAGLEFQDGGRVEFGDIDASQLSLRERRIGFVFQHYALFRHMTVEDNIAFGLRARPRKKRPTEVEILAKVSDLLKLVQLDGLEKRYPTQLSGGQRQRALRWPAPWRLSRAFCCWMSLLVRLMPRSARTCGSGCAICTRAPATPRFL